jgi:hypothetical protein
MESTVASCILMKKEEELIVKDDFLHGKRIQIVDDEPDLLETLEASLSIIMCCTCRCSEGRPEGIFGEAPIPI